MPAVPNFKELQIAFLSLYFISLASIIYRVVVSYYFFSEFLFLSNPFFIIYSSPHPVTELRRQHPGQCEPAPLHGPGPGGSDQLDRTTGPIL